MGGVRWRRGVPRKRVFGRAHGVQKTPDPNLHAKLAILRILGPGVATGV